MTINPIVATDTRWHLVVEGDGPRDIASVEVMHTREALAERERISVVVTPDDDDVLVTFEVRPR